MDCEHVVVELQTHPVRALETLTYAHWFVCQLCPVKAIVIEHVAVP